MCSCEGSRLLDSIGVQRDGYSVANTLLDHILLHMVHSAVLPRLRGSWGLRHDRTSEKVDQGESHDHCRHRLSRSRLHHLPRRVREDLLGQLGRFLDRTREWLWNLLGGDLARSWTRRDTEELLAREGRINGAETLLLHGCEGG